MQWTLVGAALGHVLYADVKLFVWEMPSTFQACQHIVATLFTAICFLLKQQMTIAAKNVCFLNLGCSFCDNGCLQGVNLAMNDLHVTCDICCKQAKHGLPAIPCSYGHLFAKSCTLMPYAGRFSPT